MVGDTYFFHVVMLGWSDNIFLSKKKYFLLYPESIHHKKYHGSCFVYLSEILSKLQTCEVTNFMTF